MPSVALHHFPFLFILRSCSQIQKLVWSREGSIHFWFRPAFGGGEDIPVTRHDWDGDVLRSSFRGQLLCRGKGHGNRAYSSLERTSAATLRDQISQNILTRMVKQKFCSGGECRQQKWLICVTKASISRMETILPSLL